MGKSDLCLREKQMGNTVVGKLGLGTCEKLWGLQREGQMLAGRPDRSSRPPLQVQQNTPLLPVSDSGNPGKNWLGKRGFSKFKKKKKTLKTSGPSI